MSTHALDDMTIEEIVRLHVLGFDLISGDGHAFAVVESDKVEEYENLRRQNNG